MRTRNWAILAGATALAALGGGAWSLRQAETTVCPTPESRFGVYCVPGRAPYDGYRRTSTYVDLPGGKRLAVDVLRPTRGGEVEIRPLPVLFEHTIYNRAMTVVRGGQVTDAAMLGLSPFARIVLKISSLMSGGEVVIDQARMRPWVGRLLRHGYVVVAADASGTGASYGAPLRSFGGYGHEAALMSDWIIAQPWSDGRIGMYGQSFTAMIAVAAAAQGRPALKAVYGASTALNAYRAVGYRGGVRDTGFNDPYILLTGQLDDLATAVDGNPARLAQAFAGRRPHGFSARVAQLSRTRAFLDDPPTPAGLSWADVSLYPLLDGLRAARTPIYLETGWNDIFTRDTLLLYANLEGPRRLTVRPWRHRLLTTKQSDLDPGLEAARWFDLWVRGRRTGIAAEPEVRLALMDARGFCGWTSAPTWPAVAEGRRLFLDAGAGLSVQPPERGGTDRRQADLTATTGRDSRWNGVLGKGVYPDLAANDAKGLTYTGAPLAAAFEVVGHPVLQISISVTGRDDAEVIALLEDVGPDGRVTYVSEGALRASARAPGSVPYRNLGLPVQANARAQAQPLKAGEVATLIFDLQPVAYRFGKGHRIRIALQAADTDNLAIEAPPYALGVHWGGASPSHIVLPVRRSAGPTCRD